MVNCEWKESEKMKKENSFVLALPLREQSERPISLSLFPKNYKGIFICY